MSRRALLRLLTWLSPAFPTGAFAYSHGIEWAVETRRIQTENQSGTWLTDIIADGSGRNDTILLRHAHRLPRTSRAERNIAALASRPPPAAKGADEALDQGEGFLLAAAAWGRSGASRRHTVRGRGRRRWPARIGSTKTPQPAAFLQTFTCNLISAAVRLVPLGQTAGLRALAALEPTYSCALTTKQNADA